MSRVLRQPSVGPAVPLLGDERWATSPEVTARLDEAREHGRAEGRAAGLAEGRGELDQLAAAVGRAVDAAVAGHRDERAAEAAATVELALRIAREVAGATIDEHGRALATRIRDVLARVDDGPLVVTVAPSRRAVLEQAMAERTDVEVVADAGLGDDEARVTGPWVDADLTADARWQAVAEAVRG